MNLNINIKIDKKSIAVIGILLLLGIVAAADQVILRDNSASSFPAGIDAPNIIYNNTAHVKVGSFTKNTADATTTTAYTGIGFKPSSVQFRFYYQIGNDWFGSGFDDSITANSQIAVGINSGGWGGISVSSTNSTMLVTGSVYNGCSTTATCGKISSMNADGFTISWIKTGSPAGTYTIQYTAYR